MVKIELNFKVQKCEHCGVRNIQRSYFIYNGEESIYIGRICLQNITNINTSGNPYRALPKLQRYLDLLEQREELDTIWSLKSD